MLSKKIISPLMLCLCTISTVYAEDNGKYSHPLYAGFLGGYGSTTWAQLVPPEDKQGVAINMSTPTHANEGGAAGGVFIGYELIPVFALEASYMRYPDATVTFDSMSIFAFNHDGLTSLTTHTETASLAAKVMLFIPHTAVRGFSSAGISGVHRYDQIIDRWRPSPTFGIGLNYDFTDRIMGEAGLSYTSGYGVSELDPSEDYVPFLYAATLKIAYRFG